MIKLSEYQAVIFDMDGLVIDSEITYMQAWQHSAASMGYELSDAFCMTFSGQHFGTISERLCQQFGADFDLAEFSQRAGRSWRERVRQQGIPLKPGFTEFLSYVKQQDLAYGLATNSRTGNARECLGIAGLEHVFSVLVTRDDVQAGKPEPDLFQLAAEKLNAQVTRCLILEDSGTGVLAAVRAGATVVYIPSTPQPDVQAQALCHHQVTDMLELLALCVT